MLDAPPDWETYIHRRYERSVPHFPTLCFTFMLPGRATEMHRLYSGITEKLAGRRHHPMPYSPPLSAHASRHAPPPLHTSHTHRSGRTGRAGKMGTSIMLVTRRMEYMPSIIEVWGRGG